MDIIVNAEYDFYTRNRVSFSANKRLLLNMYGIDLVNKIEAFHKKERKKRWKNWRKYRYQVDAMTNKVVHLVPGYEKRSFNGMHIDHIKSVWWCYKNNVSVEECADLSNLRCIPAIENMIKGRKCL